MPFVLATSKNIHIETNTNHIVEDKILVLETKLYNELVIALAEFIPAIQINANQIARLDCLLAFANVARENNYIRPVVEDSEVIDSNGEKL